jgi:ABC-type transport system involved in cytochrome bd biosynthesis fused ATPase/permease subunit
LLTPIYCRVYKQAAMEKPNPSLIKYTLDNASKQSDFKIYLGFTAATLVFGVIPYYIINFCEDNDVNNQVSISIINYYFLATIIHAVVDYFHSIYSTRLATAIRKQFYFENYSRYSNLSYSSKAGFSSTDFMRSLNENGWSIANLAVYKFKAVLESLVSVCGIFITFYSKNMIPHLSVLIIFNIIVYLLIKKKMYLILRTSQKKARELNMKCNSLTENDLLMFEVDEVSVETMVNYSDRNMQNSNVVDRDWYKIALINDLSGCMTLYGFMMFSSSYYDIITIFGTIGKFTSVINSMSACKNQYDREAQNYITYVKLWDDKTFKESPDSIKKLAKKISITDVNIAMKNGNLTMDGTLNLYRGNKILIKGKSGQGKTTFINALFGKVNGVKLEEDINLKDSKHQIVEFTQIQSFPTKNITIRELFRNEVDDSVIKKCLQIACSDDWIDDNIGSYDADIKGRHSGGQKNRLLIATKIYKVMSIKSGILMLDEPEVGSDPEVAYQIITNIIAEFPNTILFVISHLEKLADVFEWDRILQVENGVIKLI